MTRRREFPSKIKLAAFARCGGRCENCTAKLFPGNVNYDFDHRIPDGLGGNPDLGNCVCLCRACHKAKTSDDVSTIAKVKRMKRSHLGVREPGRRLLPCGRASGESKKVIGGVVERKSQAQRHRETMAGRRIEG
jgi:5-methylcytosine-specific restriction protein A